MIPTRMLPLGRLEPAGEVASRIAIDIGLLMPISYRCSDFDYDYDYDNDRPDSPDLS